MEGISTPEQLRAAGLLVFPCWARFNPEKNKWNKGPSVPKGESWKLAATRPIDDPALNWTSGVVGLPVPSNVLVLDRDTYKGANREEFETWIGAPLDWDRALIQKTVGGGEHYAFKCPWNARQLQNDDNAPKGWDTRAAGKGFICTGKGYTPNGMGVYRLACPESLPALPQSARAFLEAAPPKPPAPTSIDVETDVDQVIEALRHIDPAGDPKAPRASWLRILMALKQHFRDEDNVGQDLAERWSAGEFWPGSTPDNYVADHVPHQWGSIKAEGGVTIATLFYKALQSGWQPPASFDTAEAFGAAAAPGEVFTKLVERVRESGGDVKQTEGIAQEIQQAGCNPLQIALLAAELKVELAGAGVKDKGVSAQIDALLSINTSPGQVRSFLPEITSGMTFNLGERTAFGDFALPSARFPGDDVNDALFLLSLYQNRLRKAGGKFFWWSGCNWEPLPDDAVKRSIGLAIRGDSKKATSSRVRSIFEEMRNQADVLEIDPPGPRVYFLNGVLHIHTGELTHHHPDNGNTRTLAVDYVPSMPCPRWLAWLNEIFRSEAQRLWFLQELIGWLLVRGNLGIEKAALFIGPPRAGKGIILRLLKSLMGDALGAFSFSQLDDPKTLASMRGKNAVADGDATGPEARAARTHNGTFKTITSDDPFSVRLLYTQETWQGQLHCKLLVLCNSVPSMFDDSGATTHRWLPLLFDRSYLGNEDPELFNRLETELPGIATWAVEGLLRLVKRGRFDLPQSSLDQLDAMVSDSGIVQDFITDRLQVGEQYRCSDAELWDAYRQWAISNGHNLGRRRHVLKSLEDALRAGGARRAKSVKLEDGRFYRGFFGVGILPSENALNVLAFRPNDS